MLRCIAGTKFGPEKGADSKKRGSEVVFFRLSAISDLAPISLQEPWMKCGCGLSEIGIALSN